MNNKGIIIACALMAILGVALIEDYYLSPGQQTVPGATASTSTTQSSNSTDYLANFGLRSSNVPVGQGPYGAAYDPANQRTYVAVSGASSIAVVDSESRVVGEVALGGAADFVAYDASNSLVYAALVGSNSVALINTTTDSVASSVSVPTSTGWMAYDPVSGTIYSVDREGNSVSVLANSTLVKTIALTGLPFAAAYDPADGEMYVTNNAGAVFVIDGATNSLVGTVQVGDATSNLLGIAYNPSDHMMYATSDSDNEVLVVNGSSLAGTISGFNEPIGISFSTTSPEMFVVNSGNGTLSAYWQGSFSTVKVGTSPREAVYNPALGAVVVTDYGNSTLSLVGA